MSVATYISAASIALTGFILILLRISDSDVLIYYGKVAEGLESKGTSLLARSINIVARITVPKAWFAHFYVVYSVLMWTQLVFCHDLILANGKYSLVWTFCTIQATRRLYESYYVTNFSKTATMHVSHYLLGFIFYVSVSAICYNGLNNEENSKESFSKLVTGALFIIFLVLQLDQYRNHTHLAGLVKYTVPSHGLFSVVSSAHFLDEISIYLTVVLSVFLRGKRIAEDWSFLCLWTFVITNLSISSLETHKYYQKKFEDFNVKYAIIPGII